MTFPKFVTTMRSLVLATGLIGCGGGSEGNKPDGGDGDSAGDGATCPTFAQVTIWPMCIPCHSSTLTDSVQRHEAPAGVNFDVYESASSNALAAELFVSGKQMPPADQPQPTMAQKESLSAWVACGAPR